MYLRAERRRPASCSCGAAAERKERCDDTNDRDRSATRATSRSISRCGRQETTCCSSRTLHVYVSTPTDAALKRNCPRYDHCVCGRSSPSPSTSRSTFSLKKLRCPFIFAASDIGSG